MKKLSFTALLLSMSAVAQAAQPDPSEINRALRVLNEAAGITGHFSPQETAAIRAALGGQPGYRYRDDDDDFDDDDDYHDYDDDDYDDDDDRGKHKGKKHKHKGGKKAKQLPPGLQKKLARGGQLPPGWQKKMARGEVISNDVYTQAQILGRSSLPNIHHIPGTEIIQVGDKVARVMTDTRRVLDVIDLIVGP